MPFLLFNHAGHNTHIHVHSALTHTHHEVAHLLRHKFFHSLRTSISPPPPPPSTKLTNRFIDNGRPSSNMDHMVADNNRTFRACTTSILPSYNLSSRADHASHAVQKTATNLCLFNCRRLAFRKFIHPIICQPICKPMYNFLCTN